MLALVGRPSLHGSDACMICWNKGALRRNCRQKYCKTSFPLSRVFLFSRIQGNGFGVLSYGIFGQVEPETLGRPPFLRLVLRSSTLVGRWLIEFLAVVEHRLIPARVRSEWARLGKRGLASIWAPTCQSSSHVDNAGIGVISMRGAPIALPSYATAQFRRFFDCGRAVRCMLPLGAGRFMGKQGADSDAEQLALTDQFFDAVLGELSVVGRGQPCMLVGDFNVEPTTIPCLAKGRSAFRTVGFFAWLGAFFLAWSGARLFFLLFFFLFSFFFFFSCLIGCPFSCLIGCPR